MEIRIVNDRTEECLNAIKEQGQAALEACGLQAERYAAQNCPVITGRLRNSITHATKSFSGRAVYADNQGHTFYDGGAKGAVVEGKVYIGTNVEYAPYVENGSSRRTPRHFLKKAMENHDTVYKTIIERYLKGLS